MLKPESRGVGERPALNRSKGWVGGKMYRSLESTLLDFGIDIRSIDLTLYEIWQRVPTEDKPRKRNGAVKITSDGAVLIQNWGTDSKTVWRPGEGAAAVSLETRRRAGAARETARLAIAKSQADAAELANRIWEKAKPAQPDHPYLVRKKLPPLELREATEINGRRGRWLISPLYGSDPNMEKRNLEAINESGFKCGLRGGLRAGVYGFAGPGMPEDTLIIAEGWSTAAALHLSLEIPVIFSCGKQNLRSTAEIWTKRWGAVKEVIVAADTDAVESAEEVMKLGRTRIMVPDFGCGERKRSDWCDVYTDYGKDVLVGLWHG